MKCFWSPQFRKDIALEKMQKRVTKMIRDVEQFPNKESLKRLGLASQNED